MKNKMASRLVFIGNSSGGLLGLTALCLAALTFGTSAQANTGTTDNYTGAGSSYNSDFTTAPTSTSDATFGGTTAITVPLDASGDVADGLVFTNTATTTLGTGPLTLGVDGISVNSGNVVTINSSITLGNSATFFNNSSSGNTNFTGGSISEGTNTLTLQSGANGNSLAEALTGSGGLIITANSASNTRSTNATFANQTFTGGVSLNGGQLIYNAVNALGSNVITFDATGNNNALLGINGTSNVVNAITLGGGTGTLTLFQNTAANGTFSGAINLNGSNSLVINQKQGSSTLTVSGGITGTGNFILSNTGAGGAISLSTNAINNTGTITNQGTGSGTDTISASISSNVKGVTENSATSALSLTGVNTYSGPTTVTAGTLSAASLGTSNVTVAGGGATLNLTNPTAIDPTASLFFNDTSDVVLSFTGNDTIFTLEDLSTSTYEAAGTYTAAQLNSFYNDSVFSGVGDITVTVPEPSTGVLLLSGILLFIGCLRFSALLKGKA